jgi:hypothetical protein
MKNFLICIALCLVNYSCSSRNFNQKNSKPFGLSELNAIWDKSSLKICFKNSSVSFSESEKNLIAVSVNDQYSIEKTGVEFIGFDECKNEFGYDVILERGDSEQKSSVGLTFVYDRVSKEQTGFGMGNSKKIKNADGEISYVPLDKNEFAVSNVLLGIDKYCSHPRMKIEKNSCIRGLVLHELGHVLGLRHEHVRPEALKDPLCIESKNARLKDVNREKIGNTASTYNTPYDSRSIMNYCVTCASKQQAEGFKVELESRFQRCALKLHPEKTRVVPFSKRSAAAKQKRGTFSFLGFSVLPK